MAPISLSPVTKSLRKKSTFEIVCHLVWKLAHVFPDLETFLNPYGFKGIFVLIVSLNFDGLYLMQCP